MKVTDGIDHFLSPQQSDHYVVGLEWDPKSRIRIGVEAHYKDYEATRVRFEDLFNPFVLLPELGSDRVAITSSRAQVVGLDTQALLAMTPQLAAVFRYSYMDADDRIEGSWKPRAWSQHHTAQCMLVWQTEPATAAATLMWHSGWRTTRLPARVPIGSQIPLASIYDNGTLNDYVSLDLSLSHTWRYGKAAITAQADVMNAFNHSNHGGDEYTSRETGTDLNLVQNSETLLPWVPSVGIIVAF